RGTFKAPAPHRRPLTRSRDPSLGSQPRLGSRQKEKAPSTRPSDCSGRRGAHYAVDTMRACWFHLRGDFGFTSSASAAVREILMGFAFATSSFTESQNCCFRSGFRRRKFSRSTSASFAAGALPLKN